MEEALVPVCTKCLLQLNSRLFKTENHSNFVKLLLLVLSIKFKQMAYMYMCDFFMLKSYSFAVSTCKFYEPE